MSENLRPNEQGVIEICHKVYSPGPVAPPPQVWVGLKDHEVLDNFIIYL